MPFQFELNGQAASVEGPAQRGLLWVLRIDLGLTGAKYGCGEGHCGACTVLVDGTPVRACMASLGSVAGKHVLTVEGLAQGDKLHPLQQAFIDHGAFQCGYCTSGMLLNAYALLRRRPEPTREEITAGLEHSLCRCGAHQRVVAAIQDASRRMRG